VNTFLLFVILLGSCAGYALLFGGACEAWAAGLQLAAFAAGWAIKAGLSLALPSHHVATGLFAIDLALLSALVLLAIRATRFWPLWIAGFHCASVVAHVAKLLNPGMVGYAVQIQLWRSTAIWSGSPTVSRTSPAAGAVRQRSVVEAAPRTGSR
jgi:hypothetical protein